MKKLPIVAIVGRSNVGKSSLFNRMIARQEAVVAREEGTTRDAIHRIVQHNEHSFWLVDTAGLKRPEDDFEATIQKQINEATLASELIVVVVAADAQLTDEDRRVAKMALKSKKPVVLVVNKIDLKSSDVAQYERLGIKQIYQTSAAQARGIDDLLDGITSQLPEKHYEEDEQRLRIGLIGRPNVGKSYLFNTLAKKQQAIVADLAGTTRDINRSIVMYHGREIELMDTAGIRKSGKIEVGIEKFSVLRSVHAINESDVCMLVMDVNEHSTKLDQKIAGMIKEANKGLIIVMSKWDSLEKDPFTRDEVAKSVMREFPFIPWASLIFTSAVTGQNVTKLFDLAVEIDERRRQSFKTAELNRWLEDQIAKHPPAGLKNKHPKLRYMTQTGTRPPQFTLFGTSMPFLHWSYKRYLEKELRATYNFEGTAIEFKFREKE